MDAVGEARPPDSGTTPERAPESSTMTVAMAGAAGPGTLVFLEHRGFWRCSTSAQTMRGTVAGAAAVPPAALAVGVDVARGFPKDTNLAWPQAWLANPAAAVLAETAIHLLPLSGLAWLTRSHFTDTRGAPYRPSRTRPRRRGQRRVPRSRRRLTPSSVTCNLLA